MKFLFSVYNITLDLLVTIISYFIPKNKKLILLGSGDGIQFKGNPKYIYLYLLKNQKYYSPVWITANYNLYLNLKNNNLPVVYKYSLKSFIKIIRSKFLIIEIMTKDILFAGFLSFGNFNFIQTFHGMPLKKIANDANLELKGIAHSSLFRFNLINKIISKIKTKIKYYLLYKHYNLLISSCDDCNSIFKNTFGNENVVTLGFPRNDIFFNNDFVYTDQKKNLNLLKYKHFISYIPTYRDNKNNITHFTDDFLLKFDDYLQKHDSVLLIKKHPYDKSISISNKYKNIIDISSMIDDVMEILLFTDVLITDYSSVFFDFTVTNRPVIYYCYDIIEYLDSCRGMYYDYRTELPGPFAENEKELFELIKTVKIWFNKKDYQKKYQAFAQKFNKYKDGNSSERLVEYLKNN